MPDVGVDQWNWVIGAGHPRKAGCRTVLDWLARALGGPICQGGERGHIGDRKRSLATHDFLAGPVAWFRMALGGFSYRV